MVSSNRPQLSDLVPEFNSQLILDQARSSNWQTFPSPLHITVGGGPLMKKWFIYKTLSFIHRKVRETGGASVG
jgi:hypothetical protein